MGIGVKARERSDQAEVGCARGFPTVGRFFENSRMKTAFSCSLCAIIGGVGYVKSHIRMPNSPLLKFVLLQSSGVGGGAWAFVPLRYASDSGAARICQREGAKARERSDRAGEGVGRSPPMAYFNFIFIFL